MRFSITGKIESKQVCPQTSGPMSNTNTPLLSRALLGIDPEATSLNSGLPDASENLQIRNIRIHSKASENATQNEFSVTLHIPEEFLDRSHLIYCCITATFFGTLDWAFSTNGLPELFTFGAVCMLVDHNLPTHPTISNCSLIAFKTQRQYHLGFALTFIIDCSNQLPSLDAFTSTALCP